ncbi:MAG: NTPase [Candidatus Aenigmatarchaeota archaeon]
MKIFLSGRAGSGKSTVLSKTVELLKSKGLKVGGIVTPEIREEGKRVGFYVKDVFSQAMEVFASVDFKIEPKLGKYGIDVEAFEKIALPAIDFAIENCDVVAIDEIGKMEFFSENFKKKIFALVLLDKPLIAVLHRNFVKQFKQFGEVLEVNQENREKLPEELTKSIS